jgi:hypothetical protein
MLRLLSTIVIVFSLFSRALTAAHTETVQPAGKFRFQHSLQSYRINGNAIRAHRFRARRGQNVCVEVVREDMDGDLDVFILDTRGHEVGRDIIEDEPICFRAPRSGTYTIRVTNLSNVWTQYRLHFLN